MTHTPNPEPSTGQPMAGGRPADARLKIRTPVAISAELHGQHNLRRRR